MRRSNFIHALSVLYNQQHRPDLVPLSVLSALVVNCSRSRSSVQAVVQS